LIWWVIHSILNRAAKEEKEQEKRKRGKLRRLIFVSIMDREKSKQRRR